DRGETSSLEGGDILILSPQVLGVGISQRTKGDSIDTLAEAVLTYSRTSFKKILAFNIPKSRSFMHLDTVFTMVDRDKFTVHPNILSSITVFVMELDENRKMKITQEDGRLEDILKAHLGLDHVTLIECGRGSEVDAAREQWNDGSNTLAIAPGEVVVYSRNYVTNRSLEEAGVKVHAIPSAELSRGRGGPRCMSMPLWREDPA
ncbi:MAG: arginine deiminase, partial [Dysosmobacter sp.]|nr:arginine deiminase [Dysosmobacter sp.]